MIIVFILFCVCFVLQKNFICSQLGQSQDLFVDNVRELVYDKVGCNEHRMQTIEE